jgi:hypothetical protein
LALSDSETIASLTAKLDVIEQVLRTAIGPVAVADAARATAEPTRPPAEQLIVRLQTISAGVWLLFAIVTTVLGYVVVVAPVFGFGSSVDYAKAFLWGLGVQTAGQALQSLTPGTVTTAFGIQMPK